MTPSEHQAKVRAAQSAYRLAVDRLNAAIRELAKLGVSVTFRQR
jgi:hypothetical protein